MIIGNGLMANAFKPYYEKEKNLIIFASGVSNSKKNLDLEFQREKYMLLEALKYKKKIVYFSTCSIYDHELMNSDYVLHKIKMEEIIKSSQKYAIFRLPQVVGKTKNKSILTNFIFNNILSKSHFEAWIGAERNLIDVEDVALIANDLIKSSLANECIINIAATQSISVMQLIVIFEKIIGVKANYKLIDKGSAYKIEAALAQQSAKKLGIEFNDNYIINLIKKYYG